MAKEEMKILTFLCLKFNLPKQVTLYEELKKEKLKPMYKSFFSKIKYKKEINMAKKEMKILTFLCLKFNLPNKVILNEELKKEKLKPIYMSHSFQRLN